MDQDDTFEIQTEVCDPVIKDGLQKYVMYTFKGTDKSGFFEVTRRYNDFDVFRYLFYISKCITNLKMARMLYTTIAREKAYGMHRQLIIREIWTKNS